jgi:hypothetical protein
MGALDNDDLGEAGGFEPPEDVGKQQSLLRRAEARRGPGCEDDRSDAEIRLRSVRHQARIVHDVRAFAR